MVPSSSRRPSSAYGQQGDEEDVRMSTSNSAEQTSRLVDLSCPETYY